MSGEHSILPPSSAARRMQCPGSRSMELGYPEEDSPKAQEGTLAHLAAHAMASGEGYTFGEYTDEMLEGAELWTDTVRPFSPRLEERVSCASVHPECWGTPDAWAFNADESVIRVYDYKFGHRHVEVFENWQMLEYAAGVVASLWLSPERIDATATLELGIVQPRSYHRDGPVRTWRLTLREAMPYAKRLVEAERLAMLPDAPTITGSQCQDCKARHACATLQASAYDAAERSGDNVPFDLSEAAIGRELTTLRAAADLLAFRIGGLENEVLGKIKQGRAIPGWMTEQGSGREKWDKPVEEIVAFGMMMGVDVSKPGVLTPKQAIKKGLTAEVVAQYTVSPPGEIKLVPDTGASARNAFSKE